MKVANAMTVEELSRREELERIIQPGIANCIEVGSALREMSDRRLYRNTHDTFKAYVEEVYRIGVRTAYELVNHAEVIESLPQECAKIAQTLAPAQTRELAKVEPAQRVEVLQAAADSGAVTSKAIKKAAEKHATPAIDIKSEAKQVKDEIDVAIEDLKIATDKLEGFDIDAETLSAVADELSKVAKLLRKLAKDTCGAAT